MDGTYGNVYAGRTASPMTPSTPSAYQTNINRTKTRKWVEAKVQNYDGDDWGDDYDDEEPEEPPPPTKPTGLRQPGQGATESTPVTSPYGQTPTPHTIGPRAMPMPSHVRKTSTGLRTPSGAPPLHVQTQQHQTNLPNEQHYTSSSGGTSSLPSSITNSFPQPPGMPRQNPPNAAYSGRPEQTGPVMSPTAQTRGRATSSTQASGSPASSRFPPRKSSMSRQDMPDPADISRPRSGSRPGSSSGSARPWMDEKSNSPSQAANTSGKPLPFVRPADIYRRMEEEKQRTSLDSSRPSMDSNDGNAMRSPTSERRRSSFERDDPLSDAPRGLKTTLAPVAERRSEYGMDRLMSDPNNDAADTSRALSPSDGAKGNYITEEQSRLNKLELQSSRRLSVSPQLPDLTRMSGFGEDFFGGSHLTATTEEQPQYFAEDPDPITGPRGLSTTETSASDQPHRAPSLIEGPALVANRDTKDSTTQPASNFAAEANTAAPSGGFDVKHNQTASETPKAPRPSIPGGWVSETTNIGSETPTPMETPDFRTRQLSPPQEEISPVTESGGEDLVPTTAVKQAQPVDTTPKMVPQHDGFGGATGKHDQDVADEVAPTGPASHATPLSLPPLQTSAPEGLSGMQRDNGSNSASTTSQPEPSPSQFIPTAPLNPRRGDTAEGEFVARMPPRNLTMSSIETASPNENDRLRDDIMKSLNATPIHPSGADGLLGPSSGSLDNTTLTRESTYLSGVYDDYLGPAEDKSLQETGQAMKDAGNNNQSLYQLPSQMKSSESTNQPQSNTTRAPTFKRRFSWEGDPEEVSVGPTTDTNAPVFGADTSQDPAKSPTSSPSAPTAPPPAVHIDADNDGSMSHQVSLVSSRGPEGLGIAGLEPPSPVSILSNRRKSLVSPATDNSKRLSLADEKSLMEEISQPPSPPHAQHPALFQAPAAEEPMEEDTAAPPATSGPTSLNQPKIMAWREILSLPTLPMRAAKFEEARGQYAEMDSGLSNWLLHMQGQANGVNAAGSETDLTLPGQSPTSAGAPASAQQPYYQQYLNASNPNVPSASQQGLGRQPSGSISAGFGASGNQVGTKGKELLQAAAGFANKGTRTGIKSGMKLFNKGKSRFRAGTATGATGGDKDLQASGQAIDTPPTQPSTAVPRKRNEQRTSWGFSVWRWRRESSSQLNPTSSTTGTTTAPSSTRLHWRPRRLHADADAPPGLAQGRLGHGAQQDQQQRQQHDRPTAAPLQQGGHHSHSRSLPLMLQPHKSTPTTAVLPSAVAAAAAPSAARANGKTRPARNSQFSLPFLSSISPFKSFGRSNQSSSPWQPPSSVTPEAGILSDPAVPSESDNRDRAATQQAPLNSSGRPLGSIAAPTAAAAAPSLPSSSSPAFRGWDERVHESDSHLPQLAPPAPISKSQPTWDSSTGTPLLEEEGFDLDPPFAGVHRPVTGRIIGSK